jgi:hypothetical protein
MVRPPGGGFVAVAAFVVFFVALGWKFARGEGAWEVAE